MNENRIAVLLNELKETQGTSTRDFAKMHGIPEQTLYKVCKKPTMKNISVDVFLKIAHGLGMTAEELYTGVAPDTMLRDDQRQLLDAYENVVPATQPAVITIVESLSGGTATNSRKVVSE